MGATANRRGRPGEGPAVAEAHPGRFGEVARRAAELGLGSPKTGRIAGRVNPELVRLAKGRTGARGDSELLELALASLVLEDGFAEAFRAVRGAVEEGVEVGL